MPDSGYVTSPNASCFNVRVKVLCVDALTTQPLLRVLLLHGAAFPLVNLDRIVEHNRARRGWNRSISMKVDREMVMVLSVGLRRTEANLEGPRSVIFRRDWMSTLNQLFSSAEEVEMIQRRWYFWCGMHGGRYIIYSSSGGIPNPSRFHDMFCYRSGLACFIP